MVIDHPPSSAIYSISSPPVSYRHQSSGAPQGVLGSMVTIDERVASLETKVSVQEVKIDGLATQASMERMFSEARADMNQQFAGMREVLHKELTPLRTDIAAIKNEITHHASKAWVYAILAVSAVGAIGAIGSVFTILNVAPKH